MSIALRLPPFVQAVQEFQHLGLANKAILDATAVDGPLVTLAPNQKKREEIGFRQLLVLLIAFVIAPFHAKGVSRLCSKLIRFSNPKTNEALMQLSFKALKDSTSLKEGVKELFTNLETPLPHALEATIGEDLRKQIIKAKTRFLMIDLSVCGFLLSSVGFLKTIFGRFLNGNNQFSGEFGVVSSKKLDKLYEVENAGKNKHEKLYKALLTFGTAIGIPIVAGKIIQHSLLSSSASNFGKKFIAKTATLLDYNYPKYIKFMKGWPLLSDGSQVLLSLMITLGELTYARTKRERKELAIQRNSIDALFFFGAPTLMRVLTGSTTIKGAVDKALASGEHAAQLAAKRSAIAYIFSYLATMASVAGVIAYTNHLTQQSVKNDAAKLKDDPITFSEIKIPKVFEPFYQPVYAKNPIILNQFG